MKAYWEGRRPLGFPNEEVQYGFLKSLMPVYTPASVAGTGVDIFTLDDYIESGNTDGIRDIFEFKRDASVEEALAHISSKEYSLPFIADSRTLFKIGVPFDSESSSGSGSGARPRSISADT